LIKRAGILTGWQDSAASERQCDVPLDLNLPVLILCRRMSEAFCD
jgi:hypothetical protein